MRRPRSSGNYERLDKSGNPSAFFYLFYILLLATAGALAITFGVLWGNTKQPIVVRNANVPERCTPSFDPTQCSLPEHAALQCQVDALEAHVLQPITEPVNVTRDAFGVPTLTGGSWENMMFQSGYEQAVDRMFQIYWNYLIFSGQLASVLGPSPSAIGSDAFFRSQSYSESFYIDVYSTTSRITDIALRQTLAGINARIQEIIDGDCETPAQFEALGIVPSLIPYAPYIRFNMNTAVFLSGPIDGWENQLVAFSRIEELVDMFNVTLQDAIDIIGDTYNTASPRNYGISAETTDTIAETCSGEPPVLTAKRGTTTKGPRNRNTKTVPPTKSKDQIKKINDFRASLRKYKAYTGGSWGMSISGNLTNTGRPLAGAGPQAVLESWPGFTSQLRLVNPTLQIDWNIEVFPGIPLPSLGTFGAFGYQFQTSSQITTLPASPLLFQDPSNDIYDHTETIAVRGAPSFDVDVYMSTYGGVVTAQNVVSSLYTGPKSIVRRLVDPEKMAGMTDSFWLLTFSRSPCQFRNTIRNDAWGTLWGQFGVGADNQCNIFTTQRTGWIDWGTSDVVPQGILGEPIPPISSVVPRSGLVVFNTGVGYSNSWNSPQVQTTPNVRGNGEFYRQACIDQLIQSYGIRGQPITSSDMYNIFLNMGNCRAAKRDGDTLTLTDTDQIYDALAYPYILAKRLEEAVQIYPTGDRLAAIQLMQGYNGGLIVGSEEGIVDSVDISDQWMLGAQFEIAALNALEDAAIFGQRYVDSALLARILETTPLRAPLKYTKWLDNVPDVNLWLVEALDTALAIMGGFAGRPWGTALRPTFQYADPVLGVVDLGNPTNIPTANRAASYTYAQMTLDNQIKRESVIAIDVNANVYFTNGTMSPLTPIRTRQHKSYLRYTPTVFRN